MRRQPRQRPEAEVEDLLREEAAQQAEAEEKAAEGGSRAEAPRQGQG